MPLTRWRSAAHADAQPVPGAGEPVFFIASLLKPRMRSDHATAPDMIRASIPGQAPTYRWMPGQAGHR
jgi:hypothetical protein